MRANFDPDKHKYTDDEGKEYPSVTHILKEFGFVPPYTGNNHEIGTAVHKAISLLEQDDLGECPEYILPYLDQWKEFKAKHPIENVLIDIKTGSPADWHYLQLGAYKILVEENNASGFERPLISKVWKFAGTADIAIGKPKKCFPLYLTPDGYKVGDKFSAVHKVVFQSIMTVHNYRRFSK